MKKIPSKCYKENDYGVIEIDSPKYGLFKFLIDEEDMEQCSKINWCILRNTNVDDWREYFYATSNKSAKTNNRTLLLHRFIMGLPDRKTDPRVVDHEDFNTLDNRKQNLRVCTMIENGRNRRNRVDNQSGHNGVFLMKYPTGRERWRAFLKVDQKYVNVGEYMTYDEAVDARQVAEKRLFGEFQPSPI